MERYSIGGIQQVGMGVADLERRWREARAAFGCDVVAFRERAEAGLMTRYTRAVEEREAMLAMNLFGGGGFEIWQYTSRVPRPKRTGTLPGDLGVYGVRVRAADVRAAHRHLSAMSLWCGEIEWAEAGKEAGAASDAEAAGKASDAEATGKASDTDAMNDADTDTSAASDANTDTSASPNPSPTPYFFCRDSDDNMFKIVQGTPTVYGNLHPVGGVDGVIIGCSDIDAALPLYRHLLGYDRVVSDRTWMCDEQSLSWCPQSPPGAADTDSTSRTPRPLASPSGRLADTDSTRTPPTARAADTPRPSASAGNRLRAIRSVLLTPSRPGWSPFSGLYGRGAIELWQLLPHGAPAESHLYYRRQWGDIGFIHVCFEVVGMEALKAAAERIGAPFTVDSGDTFGMGQAGGRFAYLEDGDGTLIEFVETHQVRLLKAGPLSLNINTRRRRRPLPKALLRALIVKRRRR